MPWVRPQSIFFALATALTLAATAAYAQQKDAARKSVCEEQRLTCQKDWSQRNSFGVSVTPPDKTKLCWDYYSLCMKAEQPVGINPPKQDPLVPVASPTAACEQQRLSCQKSWAQTNSFGVPVTPPDKTKMCWDGFYACVAVGNAKLGTTPASLPPMKRFTIRNSGDATIIWECRIDGNEVRCSGRYEKSFPGQTSEFTITGRISDSIITGILSGRTESTGSSSCRSLLEDSASMSISLRPNGEGTIQNGTWQQRIGSIGSKCGGSRTITVPPSQATVSWRVLE